MKIINISQVAKTAYELGYDDFKPMADEINDPEGFDLSGYQDSAHYANVILPRLRQLAGFSDSGYGTFTQDEEVVYINQDDAEELADMAGWIDGETYNASDLFNESLYEWWNTGVWDAILGKEKSDRIMDLRVD